MDKLFDETYASEDGQAVSRNLWYGYLDLYTEGQYGQQIVLDDKLLGEVCAVVQGDSAEDVDPVPTETNWYLYGATKTTDAVEDAVRPSIMIRSKNGGFVVRCNFSDHDFALHLDDILAFEAKLAQRLVG